MRFDLSFSNSDSGASSTRLLGPPRWTLAITSDEKMTPLEASGWMSTYLQLRGRVNHLAAWDVGRPVPLGTMRGVMTLSVADLAGDTTLQIVAAGQGSRTLLPGDWLQIGTGVGTSQTVAVVAAATSNASGVITVQVEPPLRYGFPAGTQVTWDRPLIYFKSASADTKWSYSGATQGGFSFDGIESWEG
jgi:hypothetical protein